MKKISISLANPVLIYTVIWLAVIVLTSLQVTKNLLIINDKTIILIFASIFTFFFNYIVLSTIYYSRDRLQMPISLSTLNKLKVLATRLLCIWLLGTIFETIVSGGLPIEWALMHIPKNYTNFGIHSFHGIMNAIYMFSMMSLFCHYLTTKDRNSLIIIAIFALWPFLALARSVLLGVIVQMLAVYLILRRITPKALFKLIILFLLICIIFGVLGNIRGKANPFADLVYPQYQLFFSYLPSGFLWIYVYVTSPINNIIQNINHLTPHYDFYYSLFNTIPTAIREVLFTNVNVNPMSLVVQSLNVSTYFDGFLADFGIFGTIIIVTVIQFVVMFFYLLAKQKHIWAILAYAVLFECVVFSIFFNLFFLPVYIAQILLALYFRRLEYAK